MLQVSSQHAMDLIQLICYLVDDSRSEKLDDEEKEPILSLYRQLSGKELLELSQKMHHAYKGNTSTFHALVSTQAARETASVNQTVVDSLEKGVSRRLDELEQEVRDLKEIIHDLELGEDR